MMRIIVISGLSGSGKSTAVRALEDEGFFCIDNLPVALFPTFVSLVGAREEVPGIVLVMDIRGRDFFTGYEQVFQELRQAGHSLEIIFLDSGDDVLVRRFSETRRRHPALENVPVPEGIRFERERLSGLRSLADFVIDTSDLNVHELRQQIIDHVAGGGAKGMTVHLQAFGYRYGIPIDSDIVLDVRFLPNPHFVPELRPFPGLDPRVRDYVMNREETSAFLSHLRGLLDHLLPSYRREGKSYLTISIGCTGGKHRSVVIVEALREFFEGRNVNLKVTYRDMEKVQP